MPRRRQKRQTIDDLFGAHGENPDSLRLLLQGFRSIELLIEEALADAFGGEIPDDVRRTHFNVRVSLAVALNLLPAEMKDPLGRLKALRDDFAHAKRDDLIALTPSDGKQLYAGMKALSRDADTELPGFEHDAPEVMLVAFLALLDAGMTAYIGAAKRERTQQQWALDKWWRERRMRSLRRLFGDEVDPRVVSRILSELPERERTVFTLRFFESTTLEGIGKELGITRERVRQLEGQIIKRIRAALDGGTTAPDNS